jgi:hypothetical protein
MFKVTPLLRLAAAVHEANIRALDAEDYGTPPEPGQPERPSGDGVAATQPALNPGPGIPNTGLARMLMQRGPAQAR